MADRSDGAPLPALHRLHPSSLLFSLGQILRQAGTILFFALFAARGAGWDLILLITFLPTMVLAVLRYLTYGYRFADGELISDFDLLPAAIWVMVALTAFTVLQRVWHVRGKLRAIDEAEAAE